MTLFQSLQKTGTRYLVAGGVALNLHGVPRMTADLDLALALDTENLRSAIQALEAAGFAPRLPVSNLELLDPEKRAQWQIEKNLLAFPFHNPGRPFETVDLLINVPLDFEAAWSRRRLVNVGEVAIPVLSIEDLIDMKHRAGRPQDLADAAALARRQALMEKP